MKKLIISLLLGGCLYMGSFAQDPDVKEEVKTEKTKVKKPVRATFNSTRIINNHSVEIITPGNIQFMISHHFGYFWNKDLGSAAEHNRFKQNLAHLFGLNAGIAHTYLSLDVSPTKWSNVGVAATGRAVFEGWAKFRILRQQTGKGGLPFSLGWVSMANIYSGAREPNEFTDNRWSFMHQLLIARKFSDRFSLQLNPTLIHFNIVPYGINNSNLVGSIGMGAKYKTTAKLNLTMEYSRQLNMYKNLISKNGTIIDYTPDLLSFGLEVNTGGHLFQFYVGNTIDASNIDHFARNTSPIKDGKFALGFTINRTMTLKKEKE
ncbi:MAG: DUF5777 family beta-barrel protein [Chitinophagaceae bacterium]